MCGSHYHVGMRGVGGLDAAMGSSSVSIRGGGDTCVCVCVCVLDGGGGGGGAATTKACALGGNLRLASVAAGELWCDLWVLLGRGT